MKRQRYGGGEVTHHGYSHGGGNQRHYNRHSHGNQDPGALAEAVKAGQRASLKFKEAWHSYCEMNHEPYFDPSRHSNEFLRGFMDKMAGSWLAHSGGRGEKEKGAVQVDGKEAVIVTDPQAKENVAEMIKAGQRANQGVWDQLWRQWCEEHKASATNPAEHEPISLIAFVLKFGLEEVVQAEWAQSFLVSLGELAKPYMVKAVKKGQGSNPDFKACWAEFAERRQKGIRDPNKHEAGSLMEFFDTMAMPNYKEEEFMASFVTGTLEPPEEDGDVTMHTEANQSGVA